MPVEQLIFTDVLRGKGYNPSSSGFQIKACSPGLGAESRDRISAICMHYGDIVHRSAPPKALQAENEWRSKATDLSSMPASVLQEFPIIWSYTQLNDDIYVLVRVCYTGLSHDGRPGNFFAHALAFPVSYLEDGGGNPLALARSGLFMDGATGDETVLPVLPELGKIPPAEDNRCLTQPVYRDQLPGLFTALIDSSTGRTVLVCLPDWHESAPFVESLLNLFPSGFRCRFPVCTFDNDRNWNPQIRSGQNPARPPHQLLMMCTTDERELNFRIDEYQSRFAIFNFVANKFSTVSAIRPFAAFSVDSLLAGKDSDREGMNAFIKSFGQEQNPDAWDKLIDVGKAGSNSSPESTLNASRAISSLAAQPSQVQAALNWLWPQIELRAKDNASTNLTMISSEVTALIEKLPAEQRRAEANRLSDLAVQTLKAGRVSNAAALAHIYKAESDQAVLKLVQAGIQDPTTVQLSLAERKSWLDLLLDGLRLSESASPNALSVKMLVLEIFKATQDPGKLAELWNQLGKTVIIPLLEGDWSPDKQNLAQELAQRIPAGAAPEASAWLNLKLLKNTTQKGEDLLSPLRQAVAACSLTPDAEKMIAELLQFAQKSFEDKELYGVALGCIADAATPKQRSSNLLQLYQEALRQLSPKSQNAIHRKLASIKASRVLLSEFLAECIPWKPEESSRKLNQWKDIVFNSDPQVFDDLCIQISEKLKDADQKQELLPLAEELLPRDGKPVTSPGALSLLSTLLLLTPLDPTIKRPWLPTKTTGLGSEASTRVNVLQFLEEIHQLSLKPEWTPYAFPAKNPAWNIDVRSLDFKERQHVLSWVMCTFRVNGIANTDDAAGLVSLLEGINEKGSLVDAVSSLLKGRDPVTCVLVAVAFVECGLANDRPQDWGLLLRPLFDKFEKSTRQLLEAHLQHRFGVLNARAEERLFRFADAAGLSLPRPTLPNQPRPETAQFKGASQQPKPGSSFTRPDAHPVTPQSEPAETGSTTTGNIKDVVNQGKKIFQSLFGKSESPAQPETKDKNENEDKSKKH